MRARFDVSIIGVRGDIIEIVMLPQTYQKNRR